MATYALQEISVAERQCQMATGYIVGAAQLRAEVTLSDAAQADLPRRWVLQMSREG